MKVRVLGYAALVAGLLFIPGTLPIAITVAVLRRIRVRRQPPVKRAVVAYHGWHADCTCFDDPAPYVVENGPYR